MARTVPNYRMDVYEVEQDGERLSESKRFNSRYLADHYMAALRKRYGDGFTRRLFHIGYSVPGNQIRIVG